MRVLAIDYGTKKVGFALSDELRMLATPLTALPSDDHLIREIGRLVGANDVDTIVVGMPYLDGAETPTTALVRAFGERLQKAVAVPVYYWDESFSSRFARSRMLDAGVRKKKRTARGTTDMWAAALILQEYLDAGGREGVDLSSPGLKR